jgi:hypothetical protein
MIPLNILPELLTLDNTMFELIEEIEYNEEPLPVDEYTQVLDELKLTNYLKMIFIN